MTYENAKKIALKQNKKVNACLEYEKAYCFYDNGVYCEGGNAVVVFKETGKLMGLSAFVINYRPEKNPKHKKF
jgi:hypothetical protein